MSTPEATPFPPAKSKLTEDQIIIRNLRGMSDCQIANRLRNLARTTNNSSGRKTDSMWAIALSVIFDNTKSTGANGKISSYIR